MTTGKKLLAMFVFAAAAALMLTALPSTAFGLLYDEYKVTGIGSDPSDEYVFEVIKEPISGYGGERAVSLKKFTDNGDPTTDIVIPSSILGAYGDYAVTKIGAAVFEENLNLKSITIPDSVTMISDGAFAKCYYATSLDLGKGVEVIGVEAFMDFGLFAEESAGTLVLPDSLTTIYQNAFYISNFEGELVLPDSLTDMKWGAFTGCDGFTSIHFGSGLTKIPNKAFQECFGLTGNLEIPSTVTTIGAEAFKMHPEHASDITSVTLPATLTGIGDEAFKDCAKLTAVSIPSSVTIFGTGVFAGCTALTDLTLQDGLTVIGEEAFKDCTGLKTLVIPATVTSFGKSSFAGCEWLENLTFGDGLTTIGVLAFNKCIRLHSVTIPDSVTKIDTRAFDGCNNLWTVTFGSGLKTIGEGAFQECSGLRAADIPDSVTTLGTHAFNKCYSLAELKIGSGITSIGSTTFQYCILLSSVTIPNGVTSIGDWAFYGCEGLKSLTLPSTLKSVGKLAFYNCYRLPSLTLPASLTTIGESAFRQCSSVANAIEIPGTVTSFGKYAFQDCAKIPSVTFGNGLKTIGNGAFMNCASLTSLALPEGLVGVGGQAFYGCTGLKGKTLILPSTLTNAYNQSFGDRYFTKVINKSSTAFDHYSFLKPDEEGDFYVDASGVEVTSLGAGTFILESAYIGGATVTGVSAKTYTGKKLTQNPTVKLGGKKLVKNADYTLSYKNNVNAGTAVMTITGKGSYAGTKSVNFKITKASNSVKAAKAYSVKYSKVKKAGQKFAVAFKSSSGGKATWAAAKTAGGKVAIAKNGKATVKKGTKPGEYKLKVKVSVPANKNYKAVSSSVTVKITVVNDVTKSVLTKGA